MRQGWSHLIPHPSSLVYWHASCNSGGSDAVQSLIVASPTARIRNRVRLLMMNLSLCSPVAIDIALSLVKFLLPLDHDALALPGTLGLIDNLCYRGALAHEVVAVDDASRDATSAEARRFAHFMPVWLIQHSPPMGRAIAFRTAVEAACREASDDDLFRPIGPRRRPQP